MPYNKVLPSTGYSTFHDPILVDVRSVAYTLDSNFPTADSEGDKVVKAGQVLVASDANGNRGKVYPTAAGYEALLAIGILKEDVNVRNGDATVSVLVDGWVDKRFVIDEETFGTITAQHQTDLSNIKFDTRTSLVE